MMATFRQTHQIDRAESPKAREEREPLDSGTNDGPHDLSEPMALIETVEIGMGKQSVESVEIGVTPRSPTERVAIGITLEESDKA